MDACILILGQNGVKSYATLYHSAAHVLIGRMM